MHLLERTGERNPLAISRLISRQRYTSSSLHQGPAGGVSGPKPGGHSWTEIPFGEHSASPDAGWP